MILGRQRASLATQPVRRPAPEIHHRENADATWLDLVQECVRKSAQKPATNRSTERRSDFGARLDGLKAPIDLHKEGGAEPGVFKVVVLWLPRSAQTLRVGETRVGPFI